MNAPVKGHGHVQVCEMRRGEVRCTCDAALALHDHGLGFIFGVEDHAALALLIQRVIDGEQVEDLIRAIRQANGLEGESS